MKIKTQDLIGPALDWAVAKCEGFTPHQTYMYDTPTLWKIGHRYSPSTSWQDGGPIIELQGILFIGTGDGETYNAWICKPYAAGLGPTHLIAAMRCFVASRLGDEVDIPEELL